MKKNPRLFGQRLLGGLVAIGTITGAAALLIAAHPSSEAAPAKLVPSSKPASGPSTQAFPTPHAFVSNLDLECYDTPGPAPERILNLTHLNPVLLSLGMKPHQVKMLDLVETCVPVMKNNFVPDNGSLPFVRHVDFACYKLDMPALATPVPVTLRHLNKAISFYPQHQVRLTRPSTLCVPVKKDGVDPPADAIDIVRYLDLECWDLEQTAHPPMTLQIDHLNPQLVPFLPKHPLTLKELDRKLCVPVRKNDAIIPTSVLNIIRFVDLERFVAQDFVMPPFNLRLDHLNPLLQDLQTEEVVLQRAHSLMVPVSKNGDTPPQQ